MMKLFSTTKQRLLLLLILFRASALNQFNSLQVCSPQVITMYCVTMATVETDNKLPLPHHDIVPTSQTANGWQVFGSGLVVDGCPRNLKTQWIFNIDHPTPSLTMCLCLVGQNMLGSCEIQIPSLHLFWTDMNYFYPANAKASLTRMICKWVTFPGNLRSCWESVSERWIHAWQREEECQICHHIVYNWVSRSLSQSRIEMISTTVAYCCNTSRR